MLGWMMMTILKIIDMDAFVRKYLAAAASVTCGCALLIHRWRTCRNREPLVYAVHFLLTVVGTTISWPKGWTNAYTPEKSWSNEANVLTETLLVYLGRKGLGDEWLPTSLPLAISAIFLVFQHEKKYTLKTTPVQWIFNHLCCCISSKYF